MSQNDATQEVHVDVCDPNARMVVFSISDKASRNKTLPGRHEFKNYLRLTRDLLEDLSAFGIMLQTNANTPKSRPRIMRRPLRNRLQTIQQRCDVLMQRLFKTEDIKSVPSFRNRGVKKQKVEEVKQEEETKVDE